MLDQRFVVWMISVGLMVPGAGMVSGQSYPSKPIRIVTSSTGGGNDIFARIIAQGITGSMGQPVVVENRGGDVVQAEIVAQASPDGYTMLVYGPPLWIGPLLRKTSYDPVRDFSPITIMTRSTNVLVVHPSVPATSIKEFIALAKAKPGTLNYSSGATGGSAHLMAELFKAMAGVDIVRVPYSSNAVEYTDLLGGNVQLTFGGAASVAQHVKSGKLRALAITSAQPSAFFPQLPTIAASGLPGYDAEAISGAFAPAKTPAAIVNRLNQEIVRVFNRAEVKERLFNSGAEVVGSSPGESAAKIKSEIIKWGKVIKDAGIRTELRNR